MADYPDCLRYVDALPYYPSGQPCHPAIIAPIVNCDMTVGLHRTYITPQGCKISESPAKKIFPTLYRGATTGGAIQLFEPSDTLAIAEGIETALAINQMLQEPVWAATSANGMAAMQVPSSVKFVVICADNDLSGRGEIAAKELATRLYSEGKEVHILAPDRPKTGGAKSIDWLDCLVELNKHVH